jgi:ferredoxin
MSTAIKLSRHALSGHAHRVELLLSLLNVPYELVNIDLAQGEHKQTEFLLKNSLGQVPVIDDDGKTITFQQSNNPESSFEQNCQTSDGSLLAFAEVHGADVASACRVGQCGACKVNCISGNVAYTSKPSFPIDAGEVLDQLH